MSTLDIPLTIYFSSILSSLLDFIQLLWLANVLPMPFNFSILFKVIFQPIMWMILVVVTHLKELQIPFMLFNTCSIFLALSFFHHYGFSGHSLQHCDHDHVHPSRETLRAPAAYSAYFPCQLHYQALPAITPWLDVLCHHLCSSGQDFHGNSAQWFTWPSSPCHITHH